MKIQTYMRTDMIIRFCRKYENTREKKINKMYSLIFSQTYIKTMVDFIFILTLYLLIKLTKIIFFITMLYKFIRNQLSFILTLDGKFCN